jgi:hypothetical protein
LLVDIFIGLNIVRIVSLVALFLVVASNIIVLVNDVKAVNRFEAEGGEVSGSNSNSTMTDDYIRYMTQIRVSTFSGTNTHLVILQWEYCTKSTSRRILGSAQQVVDHWSSHCPNPLRAEFPDEIL